MNKTLALAAILTVSGLAGCAATEPQAGAKAAAPADAANEEYVTGSRLPRKATGDQKALSKEDWKLETNRGIGNAPRGN